MANSYNLKLTHKQLEVAKELVAGYSNSEIAEKIHISNSAVKSQVSRIF